FPYTTLFRSGRLLAAGGVPAVGARRRELAQLVSHHVLGDVDRHVAAAVVHRDGVADHLREDGRVARPGLDHLALATGVEQLHLAEELRVDVRPLLQRSTHAFLSPRGTSPRAVAGTSPRATSFGGGR